MRSTTFNICPACIHHKLCVLTDQHQSVWSCSEFEEATNDLIKQPSQIVEPLNHPEFEMV